MKTKSTFLVLTLLLIVNANLFAQDPMTLPLITIDDLDYQGAFTIPSDEYGESNSNYSTGSIAYNGANHSLFVAGFRLHGSIAEFTIPTIVNSTDVTELNSATILQDFRTVLDDTPDLNPQTIDEISGIEVFEGKLLVNGVEYYDAPANNTHTTLVVDDASDIFSSSIDGFYSLEGAAHASGWLSPIPADWQILLGGSYISGNSSKFPINSRLTMGISALH